MGEMQRDATTRFGDLGLPKSYVTDPGSLITIHVKIDVEVLMIPLSVRLVRQPSISFTGHASKNYGYSSCSIAAQLKFFLVKRNMTSITTHPSLRKVSTDSEFAYPLVPSRF